MNREKEASRRRAKHEEINKSTSEAVSWVEKWRKTIDTEGWRITGAGRRATVVRANEFETGLYIYIYISVFVSYFLSLWLHSNVRTRKENAFSLSRSRGESIFSLVPRAEAERRPFPEAAQRYSPPLWKAEDTPLIFEHGIRFVSA